MSAQKSAYHIPSEMEIAFVERMARVMRDHAQTTYPHGIVHEWSQFRHLLLECMPELRTWAARNANLDREEGV